MKRLTRSHENRWIAGVCGGLGKYLSIDPTVIRIIFILLLLPGGFPGFIPYVVLWVVMPNDSKA